MRAAFHLHLQWHCKTSTIIIHTLQTVVRGLGGIGGERTDRLSNMPEVKQLISVRATLNLRKSPSKAGDFHSCTPPSTCIKKLPLGGREQAEGETGASKTCPSLHAPSQGLARCRNKTRPQAAAPLTAGLMLGAGASRYLPSCPSAAEAPLCNPASTSNLQTLELKSAGSALKRATLTETALDIKIGT